MPRALYHKRNAPLDTPEVSMRETKLPLVPVLIAALCAIIAGYVGATSSGQAACAASMPRLEASPAQALPGETFRLQGEGFYGDFVCDDTGPPFSSRPAGGRPTDGIRVELLQGARTWTLATVASDEKLEFDAEGLAVPADAAHGEAVLRATSPTVDPRMPPPQAETPFLVLDRLPETGGPGAPVGSTDRQDRIAAQVCLARELMGRHGSSVEAERESGMAGIGKKVEGAAKKAATSKGSGKKGKGGGSGAAKAKDAINKVTK